MTIDTLTGKEFFDHRCPTDLTGKGEGESQVVAHLVNAIKSGAENRLFEHFLESPMDAKGDELIDIVVALGCEGLLKILLDRICEHGLTRRDCLLCYDDLFSKERSKGSIQ